MATTLLLFRIIQSPCLSSGKYLVSAASNWRFIRPSFGKILHLFTTVIFEGFTLLLADCCLAKLDLCSQMRSGGSGQPHPPAKFNFALVEAVLLWRLLNCSDYLKSKQISLAQVKWCLMLLLLRCVTQKMTQNLHVFTHFILRCGSM